MSGRTKKKPNIDSQKEEAFTLMALHENRKTEDHPCHSKAITDID